VEEKVEEEANETQAEPVSAPEVEEEKTEKTVAVVESTDAEVIEESAA
jgi:hypothetical protein